LAQICVRHLRAALRLATGRTAAAIIDRRTPQSTPESGQRAGYDGANASAAQNVIWPWIYLAIYLPCTSSPPMSMTVPRSNYAIGHGF
jgi:hypothetical protein